MKSIKIKRLAIFCTTVGIGLLAVQACKTYYFRSNYQDANKLLHETNNLHTKPYLKAHLKNGDVSILRDSWQVDTVQNLVSGIGTHYDFNRRKEFEGEISIPIDSVAIFETNEKLDNPESGRIHALSILAGLDAVLGIACLTNPKACFGSCPTFYMNEEDNFHYADAEGFSNAISPSLEYFDIDALNNPITDDGSFSLTMKNEALETHCVNNVKLLAYPRNDKERIFHSPANDFYLCENNYQLSQATGRGGDITSDLRLIDHVEYFSAAAEDNLISREEIYLTFDNVEVKNELGLIVSFRQTLMTTYFIYSAMGYMGDEVADIFAQMETNTETKDKLEHGIKEELGDIDIYLWSENKGKWELQDGFYETGPIAFNHQILPLTTTSSSSQVKIKVVLNRGLWRMDYFALTNIKEKVTPIEIMPNQILKNGEIDNSALAQINSFDQYLISMPGSEYKFNFKLPEADTDYELFLHSKGYYLEWMRENWLKDKDLLKLKKMVYNPKIFLLEEAKAYKQYEMTMEEQFWNSKIDTKIFSYYEN